MAKPPPKGKRPQRKGGGRPPAGDSRKSSGESRKPTGESRRSTGEARKSTGEARKSTGQQPRRERITAVPSGQLPKWVRDEIYLSTPKDRREPAISHLMRGMTQFADERYQAALPDLRKAKELSPRSATVRELLGLAAYRAGQWQEGLSELRTFRRLTGDLIHMPVEMDCLRALGRKADVSKTWEQIRSSDVSSTIQNEARVVYGSHLLDEGKVREAWEVVKPGRLVSSPSMAEMRRWYVAARVALAAGDRDAANRILTALESQETDFEGVEELRAQLD